MSQYVFKNGQDLLALCKKFKKPISEITIKYEQEFRNKRRGDVFEQMRRVMNTMKEATEKGIHSKQRAFMNLAGGDAPKIMAALKHHKKMFSSPVVLRAMAYAVATGETNACMGRIAAFPTAGGAGVVPGVTLSFAEEFKLSEEKLLSGLFTASAVGLIIAQNATLSAAAAGCQAEVGAAIAMGAAAVTEMRGGTPEQCLNASAIGLKSYLGVACDPLGGLVAVPCVKRNALGCATAMAASDLSIAGVKSYIPFDEVVEAMWRIGQLMSPKIKETALGGLAVTKTGLRVREKLGLPPLKPTEVVSSENSQMSEHPGHPHKPTHPPLKETERMIEWVEQDPQSGPIKY